MLIGRTDAKAEALVLWLPHVKNQLIGKDPDGKRWKAGKKDDRGRDGWMAVQTQWMRV